MCCPATGSVCVSVQIWHKGWCQEHGPSAGAVWGRNLARPQGLLLPGGPPKPRGRSDAQFCPLMLIDRNTRQVRWPRSPEIKNIKVAGR
jgi:hypothetical protein